MAWIGGGRCKIVLGLVIVGLGAWYFIRAQRFQTMPEAPGAMQPLLPKAAKFRASKPPAETPPIAASQASNAPATSASGPVVRADANANPDAANAKPLMPTPTPPVRYDVRWGLPGLCRGGTSHDGLTARSDLLGTFQTVTADGFNLLADPLVSAEMVHHAFTSLDRGMHLLGSWFKPPPEAPTVYLYKNLSDLHLGACVHPGAIAYYDGALHIAAEATFDLGQLHESIVHELVHHVLLYRGVRQPMWLQEGLAINVAGETWWRDPELGLLVWAQSQHLPFDTMTQAFPHTADEQFATAAYFQSLMMVETVLHHRGIGRLQQLIEALAQGQLPPARAFAWALDAPSAGALEAAWFETVSEVSKKVPLAPEGG